MSYYSTINGHIEAKTEAGLAILRGLFQSWTERNNAKYGALVAFDEFALRFDGYYRNAGWHIEPAIAALLAADELRDVDIHESTTDGFTGTRRYFMENSVPKVDFHDETHGQEGIRATPQGIRPRIVRITEIQAVPTDRLSRHPRRRTVHDVKKWGGARQSPVQGNHHCDGRGDNDAC